MRKPTLAALGVLLYLLTGALWAAPADPHKWAIVVGVNEYQRSGVSDLKYAVSDAKLFSEALTEVVGVPRDQIFLYTTEATVSTEMPRLTNLVYRLEWLKDKVQPQDTVFFYFAGHGVETGGETFLLMDNADNRSKATLTLSTLNATLLFSLLEECKAKDTLVVLDACRNDPAAGRGSQDNPMTEAMSRGLVFKPVAPHETKERNLATLFACNVGERSYEWPEKGHGYFTYYLVQGLKSGAAASAGKITLGGLSKYVRKEVAEASAQAGDKQQPTLRYEGPGPENWVLAQGGASSSSTSGAPESAESRLQRVLEENARLKKENARLQAELKALKGSK
jgi:uncharacterized caspase-like protein